jgi:hypothetical protein
MPRFRNRLTAVHSALAVASLLHASPIDARPKKTLASKTPATDVVWRLGPASPLPVNGLAKGAWASAAPDDPNRLLVCTFEADATHASHHSAAYLSLDRGNTWMKTLDNAGSDWVSEPSCLAGAGGKAYFVAGVSDTSVGPPNHRRGTMEIFRSLDGGLRWSPPHRYPFIDWTSLAISETASDNLYLFGHEIAKGIGDKGLGSWEEEIRPLLVSRDNGESFSPPRFSSDQAHNPWRRGYPVTSLSTKDGAILALYAQAFDPIPAHSSKMSFALYKVDGDRYEKVSDIHLPPGIDTVEFFAAQLAIDRSAKHPGRLYLVFTGVADDHTELFLATSDDAGKTWRMSKLLRASEGLSLKSRLDYAPLAGVAVNRDGVVGIEWMPPNGCPLFALSTDGGASVTEFRVLGKCREREPGRFLALASAKSMDTLSSTNVKPVIAAPETPGFTLRVDTSMMWSVQIVADAAGEFHAFWPERRSDGSVAVLAAAVTVGTGLPPEVRLEDAQDLASGTTIKVLEERFDPETATFGIDVVVRNRGLSTIGYPSVLEAERDLSDCGKVVYLNASGLSSRGRAVYVVPAPKNKNYLESGEATLPVHLEIQLDKCEASTGSLFNRSRVMNRETDWFYTALWVGLHAYRTKSPSPIDEGDSIANDQ